MEVISSFYYEIGNNYWNLADVLGEKTSGILPFMEKEYAVMVWARLLLPHVAGIVVMYSIALRDYIREIELEKQGGDALKSAKHKHANPLHVEGVTAAYIRIIPQVLFVDFVAAPFFAFLWGWLLFVVPQWHLSLDGGLWWSIAEFFLRGVTMIVYEVLLTLLHVFMHIEPVYKYVHRLHHRGPQCSLAGSYITFGEAALNGPSLSFFISALAGMPPPIVIFAAIAGRANLAYSHAGWNEYDMGDTPEAPFHGVHHTRGKKNSNYGFAQWLDKLLDTYSDPTLTFPHILSKQK